MRGLVTTAGQQRYIRAMKRLALVTCLMVAPFAACADIYKWVDEDGVTHYSDRPSKQGAERAELERLQIIEGGAVRRQNRDKPSAAAPGDTPQLSIDRPRPEETFRASDGSVPAAVSVRPSLASGQRLLYRVDGRTVGGGSTKRTRVNVTGLDRGSHTLQVVVVAGEREIARSEAVTFHLKPPSAIGPTDQPNAPTAPGGNQVGGTPAAPNIGSNP